MNATRQEVVEGVAEQLVQAAEEIVREGRSAPLADDAFGRARARIEASLVGERGWDARNIVNEAMDLVREAVQPREACSCGRPLRFLNPASQTAKCQGCGFPGGELCRCQPLTTEGSMTP